jgi:hypothetical protein
MCVVVLCEEKKNGKTSHCLLSGAVTRFRSFFCGTLVIRGKEKKSQNPNKDIWGAGAEIKRPCVPEVRSRIRERRCNADGSKTVAKMIQGDRAGGTVCNCQTVPSRESTEWSFLEVGYDVVKS